MGQLRAFLRRRHGLALALVMLALAVKFIVPQGYMFTMPGKQLVVTLCSGTAGETVTLHIPLDRDAAESGAHGGAGKSEGTAAHEACPYGALGGAALAGADPVLLRAALAFVIALGFVAVLPPALSRRRHVQPPLRGPPSFA